MEGGGGPAPSPRCRVLPGVCPTRGPSLPRASRASGCGARPLPSDRALGEVRGAMTERPGRQEVPALTGLHGGGDASHPVLWVLQRPWGSRLCVCWLRGPALRHGGGCVYLLLTCLLTCLLVPRGVAGCECLLLTCLLPVSPGDRRPWTVLSGGQPVGSQVATGPALPFPPGPCGPSGGLGAVSSVDLRESSGPPLAPPTKRHCRSLSEPDELARCRSPWRPGSSKVWTPVSKRRCHSGGSATLQGGPGPGLPGSTESPGGAFPEAGPTPPPAPRPASASSGFADGSRGGPGPPWCPAGACALSSRRRLSLSQEHLVDAGSPPCTPGPGRRLGLPRSRSQPCVLPGRRGRLKRRREGDARWPRPSLDFLKMTRVRLPPGPVQTPLDAAAPRGRV